jgi:hypothetical protein
MLLAERKKLFASVGEHSEVPTFKKLNLLSETELHLAERLVPIFTSFLGNDNPETVNKTFKELINFRIKSATTLILTRNPDKNPADNVNNEVLSASDLQEHSDRRDENADNNQRNVDAVQLSTHFEMLYTR